MWLLLAVVVGVAVVHVTPETRVWHRTKKTVNIPGNVTKKVFPGESAARCAMRASLTSWCCLFSQDDSGCVLYDLIIDSNDQHNPSPGDTQVTTYSRYKDVCIEGSNIYEAGEEMQRDCFTHKCVPPAITPARLQNLTCEPPFVEYEGACFYLHKTEATWCDARHHCEGRMADLAFAPDFTTIQKFIDERTTKDVWVGVKARKWVDGRDVTGPHGTGEWGINDPNDDPEDCARMWPSSDSHFLADTACTKKFMFLCQLL